MRLSIKALQYFATAVDCGSFVQAAKSLNVVPSAVSGAIDQVEDTFGLKLVQRYPAKGIQPTAAGRAMTRKIRHLIEEYDALMAEGAELRDALSGTLSVGYYAPVAPAFLPTLAAPLMAENPDVRMDFTECDNIAAQDGLLSGRFDVILFVAENVRTGIATETLLDAPPYVLTPADHALGQRDSIAFSDLEGEPLVLLDLPFTSDYYRGLIGDTALAGQVVATASSTEMVRSLVGAGVGCAVLNMRPRSAVSYAGDPLTAVPLRGSPRTLRLVLGHPGGRPRRLVRHFMDRCRAAFQNDGACDLIVR